MKVRELILFFVLLMAVYQDFPFVNYFGEIARSPIVFLTPFLVLYLFSEKKITLTDYTKNYGTYILYLVLVSLIYTTYILFKNKSIYVYDQNILVKNIKMVIYPLCSLVFYQFIYTFLKRTSDLTQCFRVILGIQWFLIVFLWFETQVYKTTEIFLPFLHANPEKYWRVRLLTVESSWSGSVVVIFTFLPIFLSEYLKRKTKEKFLVYCTSAFFFFYYTIHSESKGYLFLVLVSLLPMLIGFMYSKKTLRYILLFSLIPIGFFLSKVYTSLHQEILSQLQTSVTFGTRFTGYLTSIKTFVFNPFGIGLGPYVEIYTQQANKILQTDFMQQFNLGEIKEYLQASKNLSSKTYFFDQLVFGGIPFLLFYYLFFIKRIKRIKKIANSYLLRIVLIYTLLASVFYLTFHIKYEIWFFLAFIDYFEKNEHTKA